MRCLRSSSPESIPKTLLFAQTKNAACRIYQMLNQAAVKKDYVGMFHADLTKQTKVSMQQAFSGVQSDMRCLIATIAWYVLAIYPTCNVKLFIFQGMDIPDIEVVVVYGSQSGS